MTDTHLTTPTRFIEVDGDQFAYRRWGNAATDQPPLFLLQHFRGGMDHWDPLMTDGLAAGREVILYNGRGVASSSGKPRTRIEHMADDAAAVIRALGLRQVDVLGFSLGGYQAQDLTRRHPDLVRKLMLVGTGPRGGNPDSDPGVLNGRHGRFRRPRTSCSSSSAAPKQRSRPGAISGSAVTSGSTRIRRVHPRSCRGRSSRTCTTCRSWTPGSARPPS